jgi:hypothetical protein
LRQGTSRLLRPLRVMLDVFFEDLDLHVVGFVGRRDVRDLFEQTLYLLVLLVPLADFVLDVFRSGLFDRGIEDFFFDRSVHFQGAFYLIENVLLPLPILPGELFSLSNIFLTAA